MLANFGWIFLGNLIGSVVYGGLLAIALTNFGTLAPAGVAAKIIAIAQAKTTGYEAHRLCRHGHGLRQGDPVQLDGLPRHRRGHDHHFDHRQDRLRLHAGVHLLRAGLRAHRGQHVHHPDRHDDGRQDHGRASGGCGTRSRSRSAIWSAASSSPGWRSTSRTSRARSRRRWRCRRRCRRNDHAKPAAISSRRAKRQPAISSPNRSVIWRASSPACRSPRRRRASPARTRRLAGGGCRPRASRSARMPPHSRRRTACSPPAASFPTRRSSSATSIRSIPTSG